MSPTPTQVRAARSRAGLTQSAFAGLLHVTLRNVQQWEAGERKMSWALWRLVRHLAGLERIPFTPRAPTP